MNKTDVLNRIKVKYDLKNNADLARFLHISPSTITNWYTRETFDIDKIYTFCVGIDFHWLLTGEERPIEPISTLEVAKPIFASNSENTRSIPIYGIEASAGIVEMLNNQVSTPSAYLTIPQLSKVDCAITVFGDSMYPILKSGDLVAVKQLHSLDNIIYGNIYLVAYIDDEGDDHLVLKYVRKAVQEEFVVLGSHNQYHADAEIRREWITAIAIVKASVRYNTM